MKDVITAAEKAGICTEWLEKMKKKPTAETFVQMYFDGSDWSGENDFPNVKLARKHKDKTEPLGLFADNNEVDLHNPKQTALLGKCKAVLRFDGFAVAKVIVRHRSEATIIVKDHAVVSVDIIDNAKVKVSAEDESSVKIYNYGPNTHYNISGRVTERKSRWG